MAQQRVVEGRACDQAAEMAAAACRWLQPGLIRFDAAFLLGLGQHPGRHGCTHRVPRACCSLCTGSVPRSLPRQGGDVWVQQHFGSGCVGGGSRTGIECKTSGFWKTIATVAHFLSTVSPSLSSQTAAQPRQASRRTLGQLQIAGPRPLTALQQRVQAHTTASHARVQRSGP